MEKKNEKCEKNEENKKNEQEKIKLTDKIANNSINKTLRAICESSYCTGFHKWNGNCIAPTEARNGQFDIKNGKYVEFTSGSKQIFHIILKSSEIA